MKFPHCKKLINQFAIIYNYLLVRFDQTITLFPTNREPCSHVWCCVLQKIYLYNLYYTNMTYVGISLQLTLRSQWQQLLGKVHIINGTQMKQWPVALLLPGKQRTLSNNLFNIIGWVSGSQLRYKNYREYLNCEPGRPTSI